MSYPNLHNAMQLLAGVCDGARMRDGVGFAGPDVGMGHKIANMPESAWNEDIAALAAQFAAKYQGQLKTYGVIISTLEKVNSKDDSQTTRNKARSAAKAIYLRFSNDNQRVDVFNSYDIRGRLHSMGFDFDGAHKSWYAEVTPRIAHDLLTVSQIQFTSDQRAILMNASRNHNGDDMPDTPASEENGVIDVESGKVFMRTEYGAVPIAVTRDMPGRRWDSVRKVNWLDSSAAVLEVAEQYGIHVTDQALDLIRRESEAEMTAIAASKATTTDMTVALGARMRDYQRAGAAYILSLPSRRGFIGDDMGLGKTWQAASAMETHGNYPAVIVCPATLTLNWASELADLLPHRKVSVYESRGFPPAEIVIVSYDLLSDLTGMVSKIGCLIFDEVHYLANSKSQRTKAAFDMAEKVSDDGMMIGLSGTFFVNRPAELVSPLKLFGYLPADADAKKFLFRYCGPENNGWGWTFKHSSNERELFTWLRRTCFMRRLKGDVLAELPAKQRSRQFTQLTSAAMSTYHHLIRQAADYAAKTKAEQIVYFNKVRQATGLSKIDAAIAWARNFLETTDKSLVIFAWHKDVQNAIYDALRSGEVNYKPARIMSGMSKAQIQDEKNRFQSADPETRVIVCSIRAAMTGHTLTAASDMLMVELGWNPGTMNQTEDRIHRIGQTQSVTIWYLLGKDTIDEWSFDLICDKEGMSNAIIDGQLGVTDDDEPHNMSAVMDYLQGQARSLSA
jgi:SNF2-related domain